MVTPGRLRHRDALPPNSNQLSVEERKQLGREARRRLPRSAHARWSPGDDREDPVAILERQGVQRTAELLPLRYGRMEVSPFTFYRGTAAVQAADLASAPSSGLFVQACGDAHILNFGVFGSPERALVFDLNDFDETHPAPFEWDVKRMAASVVLGARSAGFGEPVVEQITRTSVASYRQSMRVFATQGNLEVWYARAELEDILARARATRGVRSGRLARNMAKARTRTSLQATEKLTTVVDGTRRFVDDPPVLVRVTDQMPRDTVAKVYETYLKSLPDERRRLLDQYRPVDVAHKVVGVGSVGTRAFVLLMEGRDGADPLLLQVKQALPSVLEPYTGRSRYAQAGRRVVVGQRLMQAASDIFLGWLAGPGLDGTKRDFYVRQLRDMKLSAEVETLAEEGLTGYVRLCGWTLARAHARSGDRVAIAAYLGGGGTFDTAVTEWSLAYAGQAEHDHATFAAAVQEGRLPVLRGV